METPYDELYDVKHQSPRDEKRSSLMAMIHKVPKQVADTAQTQGVSEKFMENGLPSGVISPSMLAHDRYLSIIDAVQDIILLSILFIMLPFFSLNIITGTIFFMILAYWFFHISWWEKTRVWGIKGSSKIYINHTYMVYWAVFLLAMLPFTAFAWYSVFRLGIDSAIYSFISIFGDLAAGAEKAIHDVFGNFEFVQNHFSANPHYEKNFSSSEYRMSFLIVFFSFFSVTILSKILFGRMYAKEKAFNIETSNAEMQYAGEQALDKILKARNNG